MSAAPQFSVIVATRDRAALFAEALRSVAEQTTEDTEIIVVNDGSSPEALSAYAAVLDAAQARLGPRLRSFSLVRRPRWSYSYCVMTLAAEVTLRLRPSPS